MTLTTLANLALSKIGQTLITNLGNTSDKSARLASLHLVPCLKEVLRAHFWGFAMTTRDLVELDRHATYANSQFRLTAVETGTAGNSISLAIAGGAITHALTEEDGVFTLTMGTRNRLTVSGTPLSPAAAGTLYNVASPVNVTFPGRYQWSSDATSARPVTGDWLDVYQGYLVNSVAATLEELAPIANYTGNADSAVASQIVTRNADFSGSPITYYLYDPGPGSNYWVRTGDGTNTNRNLEIVEAGQIVFPVRSPGTGFVGGLLQPMQESTASDWLFVLRKFTDNVQTGVWIGTGNGPETAAWSPFAPATGTPIVRATGLAATLTEVAEMFAAYDELVNFEILGAPSAFAATMARRTLAGGVDDSEVSGWSYAFILPPDCMKIKTLRPAGGGKDSKIDAFTRRRVGGNSCILCNVEAVTLEFVEYVEDPVIFDPLFTTAFVSLFASKLARAISGSDDLEAKFLQVYESVNLPAARTVAAQETDSNENHPLREFLDGNLTPGRGDFFPRV